jgi:lysozyme family protein
MSKLIEFIKKLFTKSTPPSVKPVQQQEPVSEIVVIPQKPIEPPPVSVPIVAGSLEHYQLYWRRAQLKLSKEQTEALAWTTRKIITNKARYQAVEKVTGVPWQLIACLAYRESGLDFTACLHNGERIIGKDLKTTLVPKGRGPFATWESACIDALEYDGFMRGLKWSIAQCLRMSERFNGLGYMKNKLEMSPYVWAGTDIYDGAGKYTSDGKYDPKAIERQLGVAAIMMKLKEMNEFNLKEI